MTVTFQIDTLPLSQGSLGLCALPGRNGDKEGDLARIVAFRPSLVLSLTPKEELKTSDAADLPDRLAEAGINWRHFPIDDFETPQAGTAPLWQAVATEARAAVDAGSRVLIHCKAGRGRTGAVALRLMIEAGENPACALARLRAARPGAVETDAQHQWAVAGESRSPAP